MSGLGDFDWRQTKDGQVWIARAGRVVTTLSGPAASRFITRVEGADEDAAQHLMARATGNYKRGNER